MQCRRLLVCGAAVASQLLVVASSRAQGCPPDEWFCEPEVEAPSAPEEPAAGESAAPEATAPAAPAPEAPSPAPALEPSPPDFSGGRIRVDRSVPREPTERGRSPLSPWSTSFRVEGVLLEGGGRGDPGLGGFGLSLRYRVNPVLALDLGADSILGTDYNGYDRGELAVSLSSLIYLNPHHRAVRTYLLGGFNLATARVELDEGARSFGYFGVHAGLGLEIPLARRVALNFDLLGFMRGRTDSFAARQPEFTDSLGRATNMSGGGLFRGGVTLRW